VIMIPFGSTHLALTAIGSCSHSPPLLIPAGQPFAPGRDSARQYKVRCCLSCTGERIDDRQAEIHCYIMMIIEIVNVSVVASAQPTAALLKPTGSSDLVPLQCNALIPSQHPSIAECRNPLITAQRSSHHDCRHSIHSHRRNINIHSVIIAHHTSSSRHRDISIASLSHYHLHHSQSCYSPLPPHAVPARNSCRKGECCAC